MTVLVELQQLLKTDWTDPHRLALAISRLPDSRWDTLSNEAQEWVNSYLREIELSRDERRRPQYPPLEGLPLAQQKNIAGPQRSYAQKLADQQALEKARRTAKRRKTRAKASRTKGKKTVVKRKKRL